MNYIDLFHGIGGFALGAYWAGMKFENHFCSDIESYAQKLYQLRFPDSIQLGDITKINTEELKKYGSEWIITGGFPCQDISIAGKGVGLDGSRSGLWFEYWRIIRDLRPKFAIMENVGALTFRGLDRVLGSLAEIGYDAEWQDIRASDVGAPHRRERIWIVAYPSSCGCNARGDTKREHEHNISKIGESSENIESRNIRECGIKPICSNNVPDTSSQRKDERWDKGLSKTSRIEKTGENHRGRTPVDECGEWWAVEPDVGRLVARLPGRVDRLKGLGNAIVPQIAKILFEQIKPLL